MISGVSGIVTPAKTRVFREDIVEEMYIEALDFICQGQSLCKDEAIQTTKLLGFFEMILEVGRGKI